LKLFRYGVVFLLKGMIVIEIYREKARVSLGAGMTVFAIILAAGFAMELEWLFHLAVPILLGALSPYLHFKAKEKHAIKMKKAETLEGRSLLDRSEWIFQRDTGKTAQLDIIDQQGEYIGIYKSVNDSKWTRAIMILFSFSEKVFSGTKGIFNSHGKPVVGFRKMTTKRGIVLEVRNEHAETVGTYEEVRFKSMMKRKGTIKLPDGTIWIHAETSTAAGDFHLTDIKGSFVASYRFGYFDYALAEPFENGIGYELIKVNPALTQNEKALIAAVVCYWMSQ